MDATVLKRLLEAEVIDPDAYSLDCGVPFEAYVLGRQLSRRVVYYSERDFAPAKQVVDSECEAPSYILELILRDSTTRRLP